VGGWPISLHFAINFRLLGKPKNSRETMPSFLNQTNNVKLDALAFNYQERLPRRCLAGSGHLRVGSLCLKQFIDFRGY
jgi:hypothetical protein